MFLTSDTPGIGGRLKTTPDDFRVDEIALYPFIGDGEHTIVRIEKIGIASFEAVRRLCRHLGDVREDDVGIPGLKDAKARATQYLSLPRVDLERVRDLELPGVRVLEVTRHTNKLKRGHLRANTFTCTLRDVEPDGEARARSILDTLVRRGVPNYYGDQRFGGRGTTADCGLALVRGDLESLFMLLLGDADDRNPAAQKAAEAYRAGDLQGALNATPTSRNTERRMLHVLIETDRNHADALRALPKKLKGLYVSALQSSLFNRVVQMRLDGTIGRASIDAIAAGDVAMKEDSGGAFVVAESDLDDARARCDRWEVSPTGPLYGTKLLWPEGQPGDAERRVLADIGLTLQSFDLKGGLAQKGARRALRYKIEDASLEYTTGDDGATCTVRFTLPSGCYATNLLAELMKTSQPLVVPVA